MQKMFLFFNTLQTGRTLFQKSQKCTIFWKAGHAVMCSTPLTVAVSTSGEWDLRSFFIFFLEGKRAQILVHIIWYKVQNVYDIYLFALLNQFLIPKWDFPLNTIRFIYFLFLYHRHGNSYAHIKSLFHFKIGYSFHTAHIVL